MGAGWQDGLLCRSTGGSRNLSDSFNVMHKIHADVTMRQPKCSNRPESKQQNIRKLGDVELHILPSPPKDGLQSTSWWHTDGRLNCTSRRQAIYGRDEIDFASRV